MPFLERTDDNYHNIDNIDDTSIMYKHGYFNIYKDEYNRYKVFYTSLLIIDLLFNVFIVASVTYSAETYTLPLDYRNLNLILSIDCLINILIHSIDIYYISTFSFIPKLRIKQFGLEYILTLFNMIYIITFCSFIDSKRMVFPLDLNSGYYNYFILIILSIQLLMIVITLLGILAKIVGELYKYLCIGH